MEKNQSSIHTLYTILFFHNHSYYFCNLCRKANTVTFSTVRRKDLCTHLAPFYASVKHVCKHLKLLRSCNEVQYVWLSWVHTWNFQYQELAAEGVQAPGASNILYWGGRWVPCRACHTHGLVGFTPGTFSIKS